MNSVISIIICYLVCSLLFAVGLVQIIFSIMSLRQIKKERKKLKQDDLWDNFIASAKLFRKTADRLIDKGEKFKNDDYITGETYTLFNKYGQPCYYTYVGNTGTISIFAYNKKNEHIIILSAWNLKKSKEMYNALPEE